MTTLLQDLDQRQAKLPQRKIQSVGNYLLDRLFAYGLDHIFGIPGDYVLRFDKLIEEHPIQFINSTREDMSGYSADAYARMKGIGCSCITYGVGINILNATAQAFVESSPVVIISGSAAAKDFVKSQYLHHLINKSHTTFHDTTQLDLFKQVTVDQVLLENPETAAEEIDRVLHNCVTLGKPVYIEIPRDIVDAPIKPHTSKSICFKEEDQKGISEVISQLEELFKKSEKPLLWLGRELQVHGLLDPVMELIEKYDIPFATTLFGKSLFGERHPLFVGLYQGEVSKKEVLTFVNGCDLIVGIGMILSDINTGIFSDRFDNVPNAKISAEHIQIKGKNYSHVSFQGVVNALSNLSLDKTFTSFQNLTQKEILPFIPEKDQPLKTERMFECLQSKLTAEHIIVTDIGDCLFGSVDLVLEQDSYIASAYYGALGSGLPMSIGAQIAVPERRCILLIGDGGLQMSATELSTIVKYGLNVIVLLMNNHGYGTERPLLEGSYNDLHNWNYTLLTKVMQGGVGIRVETEDQLENALSKAFADEGQFYLVEAELGKTDFSSSLKRFLDFAKRRME